MFLITGDISPQGSRMRATLQVLERVTIEEGRPSGVPTFIRRSRASRWSSLSLPRGARGSVVAVVSRPSLLCPCSCVSAALPRIATLLLLFPPPCWRLRPVPPRRAGPHPRPRVDAQPGRPGMMLPPSCSNSQVFFPLAFSAD